MKNVICGLVIHGFLLSCVDGQWSGRKILGVVDGQWSAWSKRAAGKCKWDCKREVPIERTCTNPAPSGGGLYCKGNVRHTVLEDCSGDACSESPAAQSSDSEFSTLSISAILVGCCLVLTVLGASLYYYRTKLKCRAKSADIEMSIFPKSGLRYKQHKDSLAYYISDGNLSGKEYRKRHSDAKPSKKGKQYAYENNQFINSYDDHFDNQYVNQLDTKHVQQPDKQHGMALDGQLDNRYTQADDNKYVDQLDNQFINQHDRHHTHQHKNTTHTQT